MNKISLVIPTYQRKGILAWTLSELERQSLSRDMFEVVVVDDCSTDGTYEYLQSATFPYNFKYAQTEKNSGPATARNIGVSLSSNPIICFIGDDAIPSKHLLYRHILAHHNKGNEECAIQGYAEWHPSIPPDDFHRFLHGETKIGGGGIQANWAGLKDNKGNWVDENTNIPGWFLTLNCSITRSAFDFIGGFNPSFPRAAWEDIELSLRLATFGYKTYFCRDSVVQHFHKQTLDSFIRRQIMEGKSRLHLVALHPHMAPQLLDVEGMRRAEQEQPYTTYVELARELHYNQDDLVQEARQHRWMLALRLASLEGIRQGLEERGRDCHIWWAVKHLHLNDAIMQVVGCAAAWEKDDLEYATVCYEWANKQEPDSWVMPAIRGEILLKQGKTGDALAAFRESMSKSAGEKWPLERVEELSK